MPPRKQWPITVGTITVDEILRGDPQDLAQRFQRLRKTLIAGLQSPRHVATLHEKDLWDALTAIGCAYDWLNHIPSLRRQEAALAKLRDPAKPKRDRERQAIACLLGLADEEAKSKGGRPRDSSTEWLVWAYRYLIGQVGLRTTDDSGEMEALALRTNAGLICGTVPTDPRSALAFLNEYLPHSQSEPAIAKRLRRAGVRPVPDYST